MLIAIGMILPNGATVLEFTPTVILAKVKEDEYATWRWDGKETASTYWGHYFHREGALVRAAQDFELRKELRHEVHADR